MKKHLLMLLALLAFILPARAESDLLFNFAFNSSATATGTAFNAGANVTQVIENVTYGDSYNVTDYVSAITAATNARYNSVGGLYLGANGSVTISLKKTYKVTSYEVMGPTTKQYSGVNTSATVTINGHTYSDINPASSSANFSRVQYTPTSTEDVSSFTIKAGSVPVYIKSVHIFLEGSTTVLSPVFVPAGGRVPVGTKVTVVNRSPTLLMDVSWTDDNVANYQGETYEFTLDQTGTKSCWAQAHNLGWSTYSEQTDVTFEVYDNTPTPKCPKPTFSPDGGTVGPETHVTVSCAVDADYMLEVTGEGAATTGDLGEYTFTLPKAAGTYTYTATAIADGYEDSDPATVTFTIPQCAAPTFSPDEGTFAPGKEITVHCTTPGASILVMGVDLEEYNLANGGTFTLPATPGTYEYMATAKATGYAESATAEATYTVAVAQEVAPVISFSIADGSRLDANESHEVTLSLNADVNPVPDYIYYTLDGYKAHNTTNSPTEQEIYSVAVNKTTLKATEPVTIHADAHGLKTSADHKSLTINAWAKNSVGEDVAAATYTFLAEAPVAAASVAPRAAAGTPVTISAAEINSAISNKKATVGDYTFEFPSYSYSSPNIAFLQGQNFTITSNSGKISSIKITWTGKSGNRTITCTADGTESTLTASGTGSTIEWTGEASSVKFASAISSFKQMLIKSFEITPSGPVLEPVATPVISGATEGETYTADVTVSVSCETEGATITLTDNGTPVTANANGTYTITGYSKHALVATASKDGMSKSEAKLNFTIKDPNAKDDVYKLVTSADELTDGAEIIIAGYKADASKQLMTSTAAGSSNGYKSTAAPSDFDGVNLTYDKSYMVLTVKEENGKMYLKSGEKYLAYVPSKLALNTSNSSAAVSLTKATPDGKDSDKTNAWVLKLGTGTIPVMFNRSASMFRVYNKDNDSGYSYLLLYRKGDTTPTCEAPTFDKTAGRYETKVTVNISCKTEGATVHYQLNGGEAVEGTSVTINRVGENTLKAWATKEGMADSKVTTATYTIYLPPCATVTVTGVKNNAEIQLPAYASLTFGCDTEGATVKYQLDGLPQAQRSTSRP